MKSFFRQFQNEKMVMHSAHSVNECVKRLKAEVTAPLSIKSWHQANAIVGTISDNYMDIRVNSFRKNSFRRSFKAKIENYSGGAKIAGKFCINPIAKFLCLIFMSLLAAISIFCVVMLALGVIMVGKLPDMELAIRLIFAALLFPIIWWAIKPPKISGDDEVLFIKQFLKSLLNAEELSIDNSRSKFKPSSNHKD